ncbi:arylsulfatase [Zhouia amylolytica]|uniref:Arylsulfatase A family protein n=1 Tax=Zhouia amylolytica AD3 TaxID=1286632 RepID=W2ULI2_9FLAO|nr:arylsulfatase [Zhouia amylolytica]ETN94187.1 arylsulfatase A family protein [Zhouia amylolytica AD3]
MKSILSIPVRLIVLMTLIAGVSCNTNSKETADQSVSKPNIVFIIADDMGIGDLGSYGQKHIKTPNLDQLAQGGMRFTQFYAGSTVCAPSRASLMTGQHTGVTHIRGNGEFPLRGQDTIIPQLLKKQGYRTAMYGKWGLGVQGTPGSPEKKGWDEFTGHLHHVDAHFQRPDSLWTLTEGKSVKIATPEDSYGNNIFTQKALNFINDQSEETPFFLYLSFTVPHAELVVPEKYMKPYLDEDGNSIFAPEKAWPDGRHYGGQPFPKAAYAAMVGSIDDYVGEVVDALKKKGLDKNTLVVFTSDNGTHIEGGRQRSDVDFFKSSGVYKGVKRDLYEGGIREPFIAYWPGTIKASEVSDHVGAFWDILPTFYELSGGNPEGINTSGISFVNELYGKPEQKKHDHLYWEFYEGGGKQAVLKDEWKAIRLKVKKDRNAPIELYNLANDPSEEKNVADDYPDVVKMMDSIMTASHTENPLFSFDK